MGTWRRAAAAAGDASGPPPFWAFAWAGGQALARHLLDHPEEVRGRSVLDLATGSGICAIAASLAGARSVTGADIDPLAGTAAGLNATANGVRFHFEEGDPLDQEPPAVDAILAGDVFYERGFALRAAGWLARARAQGSRVLVGDPGRAYLPRAGLIPIAEYEVPAVREVEDRDLKLTGVFSLA